MTDGDVFGKLSRIFETHAFSKDDSGLNDFLEDFDHGSERSPGKKKASIFVPDRPTPFDVWRQKNQKNAPKPKPTPKLNGQQWDRLVDKMHQSNKIKQSAMTKEQNLGLAMELGGYQFKPNINKTSLDLSATMKALQVRMPEMIQEREKVLEHKRKESALQEVAECTFSPKRFGAKTSDMYLKKMGREKVTPEDLFRYQEEKLRRNEIRKQIVTEIEDKELTFKPQLSEKSIKLQNKLIQKGVIDVDPLTRTTTAPAATHVSVNEKSKLMRTGVVPLYNPNDPLVASEYFEGPPLTIESEHPYRNNTNEYTTVQIPNAIGYTITFSDDTRTESIYDYIKFYEDESHTEYFGAGKYSGGTNNTTSNWPGINNRPPLTIANNKFIIHFKTNGTINDWGFSMKIIPIMSRHAVNNNNTSTNNSIANNSTANHSRSFHRSKSNNEIQLYEDVNNTSIPLISHAAKNYRSPHGNKKVHERLYQNALDKANEQHNFQVEIVQTKLNIGLKPWEKHRDHPSMSQSKAHSYVEENKNTHLAKSTITEAIDELIIHSEDENEDNDDDHHLGGNVNASSSHNNNNNTSRASIKSQQSSNKHLLNDNNNNNNHVALIEFDDAYLTLWKQLRQ